MKSKIRILVSLITVATLLFSLAACGSRSAENNSSTSATTEQATSQQDTNQQATTQAAEPITLRVSYEWPSDSDALRKPFLNVVDSWNAANPNIKLELDATAAESHKEKMKVAIAANDFADVFTYWGGGVIQPFVEAEKVLALDDYLKDGTSDRIIGGTLINQTFNGKVYGLPFSLMAGIMYCNKEMFEQNNIKLPETYAELVTAVKAFRAKGIQPMACGEKDQWPATMYFDLLATRAAGAQLANDALAKKASFEDPSLVDAANKMVELINLNAFNDNAVGLTRDESEIPFINGQIPIYVNGSWVAGSIQAEGSKVKDKIVALRFPVIEGGKGDINEFTGGAVDGIYANAGSKYKDEAAKLVKYLAENLSREAFLAGAGLPTWKFDVDNSKIDPLNMQIYNLTKDAKSFSIWWNTALTGADAVNYQNMLQELFVKPVSGEQFMKNLQSKLNENK